jgi:hypothetical protein
VRATATSFSLSKDTGGGDTAPAFSGLCVYLQFTWEVFPPLLWSFPPTTTFTSFPTPGCWVCAAAPAFSSRLVVRDFPSPPSALGVLCPLCYVSFLLLLLIIQFFFLFSLGGGWSVQGAMLLWPRVVCGFYHMLLSSPCGLRLPEPSGHRHVVVVQEPSWFFHLK